MRKFLVLGTAGLLLLFVHHAGIADTPGNPTKWSQMPQMGLGFDYSSEDSIEKLQSIVADDWECRSPNPVTDIHWWGSYWSAGGSYTYYSNGLPNAPAGGITSFVLKIWSDVPQGPGVPFSHPGQELWSYETSNFNEQLYGTTNPGAGLSPETVYQYYVTLPANEWFAQDTGTIYWLSVTAKLPDTLKQWGWHESETAWNDAAVQRFNGTEWYTPCKGVNMAFELTMVPEPSSLVALAIGCTGFLGFWVRKRQR